MKWAQIVKKDVNERIVNETIYGGEQSDSVQEEKKITFKVERKEQRSEAVAFFKSIRRTVLKFDTKLQILNGATLGSVKSDDERIPVWRRRRRRCGGEMKERKIVELFIFLCTYTLKATTRRLQIARAIFISATSCFVRLKTLTYVDAACSLASREEFLFLRAFMCFCRSIIVKISTRPGFLSFSFSKNAHTRTLQHISLASALLF